MSLADKGSLVVTTFAHAVRSGSRHQSYGPQGDRTLPLRAYDSPLFDHLHPPGSQSPATALPATMAPRRLRPRGSLGDRTLPLRAYDAAFFRSLHPPGLTEPRQSIPSQLGAYV
jgi:hypothetical protein